MAFYLTDEEKNNVLAKHKDLEFVKELLLKPVEEVRISARFKPKTKKYPNQIFIYYLASNNTGSWNEKIYNLFELFQRHADRQENIYYHFCSRYPCHIYASWEKLIEDEGAITTDITHITNLFELSKKYPL